MDQTQLQQQQQQQEAVVPDGLPEPEVAADAPVVSYNDLFPALPDSGPEAGGQMPGQTNPWAQRMRVGTSSVTQVFHVPSEERKTDRFGEDSSMRACGEIMQKTGTNIEASTGRDHSLTFIISGKQEQVLRAKRLILENFQTQVTQSISIPKEHHRFILGRGGQRLRELEAQTATKIHVPGQADPSDKVNVTGIKDGIEKAVHELQSISDEQSKQAYEKLEVPKKYHPFICGAHNENIIRMQTENPGIRINVPPLSVMKDELTVTGEKEGVMKAKQQILAIYQEMERKCTGFSVEVRKSQHKYLIGPRGNGIAEILQKTGVFVEMPPSDSTSDTITLRGPQDKLGEALTMVYEKANSVMMTEVNCPVWCHKYIIGKKGAEIRQITADLPKVHVEFDTGSSKVKIEGPKEDVEKARERIEAKAKELEDSMCQEQIDVPTKYHKHIIGKAGANINRIKCEYSVYVSIPENESSTTVKIEGPKEGVMGARDELLEMTAKMENEKERDIIIENRFHRQIIGSKGETITQIRQKFEQVQIVFPRQGEKSDVVKIRGPRDMVDQCYKHLQKLVKGMQEAGYQERVSIYKQHHKFIIGKGGANIRKIRDETNTRIDLPDESSDSSEIVITGRKEDVLAARDRIQKIQNELDNIVQRDIMVPCKFHNSIIGPGGRLIQSIMEECGGVQIKFPPSESKSDKVTIRGPKDDVQKAETILVDLANEKTLNGHTADVRAKHEHHRFLIGKNGSKIEALREETGTRIVFPSENDKDCEIITIMGKKENVERAKEQLEKLIRDLDLTVTAEMSVDPRHHRHFVARRAEVLREIKAQYGGVEVSFPRPGTAGQTVTLKGAKDCVEAARHRIQEIVEALESQVTIEVEIPQKHHGTVMGARGSHVQHVTQQHQVQIKFPDRADPNAAPPTQNGTEEPAAGPRRCDLIRVTGPEANCLKAKAALLELVPVTIEVEVPFDYHRFIIGQKGKGVREMMKNFDVNISIPPAEEHSSVIRITGTPNKLDDAREGLLQRVKELDAEMADRELRSFTLQMRVNPDYHPKIIGRKGAVISKIRMDHEVNVQFPPKDSEEPDLITITGYEEKARAAEEAIRQIVGDLDQMTREELRIDPRVHARIIGGRGKNIRAIMTEFQVDVRFPRAEDAEDDLVVITGAEEAVFECVERLRNLEEEYMQDVAEREEMNSHVHSRDTGYNGETGGGQQERSGFVVSGAPWQQQQQQQQQAAVLRSSAPDMASAEEFPSFGDTASSTPVMWGPSRR
ncbi:vigilin-like [Pollicipes pollicipes]|uniref:vigilin-like n=1 Tax=Pollicipes pollicipes TaxID=41117 RepID=UPI0018849786|nr:vigilin-like [Pollicipes pollicipes]